jgi:hypothetical protein
MTPPRSFTNLHRAGRSAKRKIAFCRRNKRDVAPRTRRRQTCRLPVTATVDFLAADILNRCGRASPRYVSLPKEPDDRLRGASNAFAKGSDGIGPKIVKSVRHADSTSGRIFGSCRHYPDSSADPHAWVIFYGNAGKRPHTRFPSLRPNCFGSGPGWCRNQPASFVLNPSCLEPELSINGSSRQLEGFPSSVPRHLSGRALSGHLRKRENLLQLA